MVIFFNRPVQARGLRVGAAAAGGWGAGEGGRRRAARTREAAPRRGGTHARRPPQPRAEGAGRGRPSTAARTSRGDADRGGPPAAVRVRGWERPPRAGECVGMFHEEHHCNGLIFSTLRLTTTASATANVPKLPQQYFAGAMATRLQM